MATYDFTDTSNSYGIPLVEETQWKNAGVLQRSIIDFSKQNLTGGSDDAKLMDIPAGTIVLWVYVRTITADSGVTDINIGDDTVSNSFIDAADVATAGNSVGSASVVAKYFSTADHITIEAVTGNPDTLKLEVVACVVPAIDKE